jgi:hypothetical protein
MDRDWSSDVCSSDLDEPLLLLFGNILRKGNVNKSFWFIKSDAFIFR